MKSGNEILIRIKAIYRSLVSFVLVLESWKEEEEEKVDEEEDHGKVCALVKCQTNYKKQEAKVRLLANKETVFHFPHKMKRPDL